MKGRSDADLAVAGTSYFQKPLKRLAGYHGRQSARVETAAVLVPEPDNEHDEHAVKVLIDGQHVGYLPADQAEEHSPRLQQLAERDVALSCPALIIGGGIEGRLSATRKSYGVRLVLPEAQEIPMPKEAKTKGGCCGLLTITALAAMSITTYLILRRRM